MISRIVSRAPHDRPHAAVETKGDRHAHRGPVLRPSARRIRRRVIKIETLARAIRCANGESSTTDPAWWYAQARNKKSVTLNLRERKARRLLGA